MDKADTYSFETISYNTAETHRLEKNLYYTLFSLDKKSQEINNLFQSWFDKGETLLTIIYNSKEDKSYIFRKNPGEKLQKEITEGLTLLYIKTKSGNLEFGYE